LSPRAAKALAESDFWFTEDTRQSAKLQVRLGTKRPMKRLDAHTGAGQIETYVRSLAEGASASLVTDGGCPVVSDPGAALIDHCHEAGVEVDAIPGPSAVTTALMLSGFYAQRFAFLGFPPRKAGDILRLLSIYADSSLTLVLFESAQRTDNLLKGAFDALGPRRYAICREMTKVHQQVHRAKLPEIPNEQMVPRRGEYTIVVEGKRASKELEVS
jgi:16S rRNA (cytidine1402-2'-O)-methyltransferase